MNPEVEINQIFKAAVDALRVRGFHLDTLARVGLQQSFYTAYQLGRSAAIQKAYADVQAHVLRNVRTP